MNTFPSTVDWLAQRAGLPAKKRTDAAIWAACRRWDYAQTNDVEIQEKDRQTARLAEAEELSLEAPDRAFRIWLHLAERGSVWAMLMVAWCYLDGYGVAEDRARAMSFYRQATTGGSTRALLDYAGLLRGQGGLREAAAVLERWASEGWAPAQFWFAFNRIQETGETKAVMREMRPMLESAAAQGSLAASWLLARKLAQGRFGVLQIPAGLKLMSAILPRLAAASGVEL